MSAPPTYTDVVNALSHAAVPLREIQDPGHVAVSTAGGRIAAMAFSADGPNLFWSNPQLSDSELVKHHCEKLVGGFGGDRLWFAPELDYHWDGKPDWDTFSNYEVPTEADPGVYRFIDSGRETLALRAQIQLPHRATGQRVGFEVDRTISMTPPPLAQDDPLMKEIQYVGIETSHVLRFDSTTKVGRVDLWHLLQVPTGSVLIVPLKSTTARDSDKTPLSYGMPGGWVKKSNCILWRYGGEARAKFGLSASALTGRTAVLRELGPDYLCLIVREFGVDENAPYGDHPYGVPRADQAFQAWDGFGFGEMEYHSPMLDAGRGPEKLAESDRLWAFGGRPHVIGELVDRLLGIDAATSLPLVSADPSKRIHHR